MRSNRRSALAAFAGAALAITATKAATAASHPDQLLLDLGVRYDAALIVEDQAMARWNAAFDAFEAGEPVAPPEMRHRMDDHFTFRFPVIGATRIITDGETSDLYNEEEVEMLRAKPRTKLHGYVVDLASGERTEAFFNTPFNEITQAKHLRSVPDLEAQARADEIIAAWDRHAEACAAVIESCGYEGAEDAYYDTVRAREAIGDEITAARATTLQGLAVRAKIVSGLRGEFDEEDENDGEEGGDYEILTLEEKMLAAILRDLAAMVMAA